MPAPDRPGTRAPAAPRSVTVLGGGLAGLAAALYAGRAGLDCRVHEASGRVGGNCATLRHDDFLFDTGAHRFHDKDAEITRDVKELLGDALAPVRAPSQIVTNGTLLDFPLTPMNLVTRLGGATALRAAAEVVRGRLRRRRADESFLEFATRTYGPTIAGRFLLNYSEKLWGLPPERLSPEVSGSRLKGLNARTLLAEVGRRSRGVSHLDGTFYYPEGGIGRIAETMADRIGRDRVRLGSRVTRLAHDGSRITAVGLADGSAVGVDDVVSSLPLARLVAALDPPPPASVLERAARLRFRRLVLVALFLDTPRISPNASVYFPDRSFPFTRVCEPKNRSASMSPAARTSLVAEIPCGDGGDAWERADEELVATVRGALAPTGWLEGRREVGWRVERIPCAYPVLEMGISGSVREVERFLGRFENLVITGRNGRFAYRHIHDVIRSGKDLASRLAARRDAP